MDIYTYLLNEVVQSTTPPDETPTQTQARRDAIAAMFGGYDPADTMEAMIACHCIELQFLLKSAVRDASNNRLGPDNLARNRNGAMTLSKTWNQWVTKLEKIQHRKRTEAADALKAAQANAGTGPEPIVTPLTTRTATAPPPPKALPGQASSEPVPGEQPDPIAFNAIQPAVVATPASVRPLGSEPAGSGPAGAAPATVARPDRGLPNEPIGGHGEAIAL
jgi:hypothetical protein